MPTPQQIADFRQHNVALLDAALSHHFGISDVQRKALHSYMNFFTHATDQEVSVVMKYVEA